MPKPKSIDYINLLPEQLPKEDDYSYALFRNFCLLGHDRRLAKVAISIFESTPVGETSLPKIGNKLKHLSTKFRWTERAKLFDKNRILANTDLLIIQQQQVDAEWVEKYKESRELLQYLLADSLKIKEANSLLLDAAISKLESNPKIDVLVAINKIVNGVVTTNLNLCKILNETWQFKHNAELISTVENEILNYPELDE